MEGSPSFKLSRQDIEKILIGAGVAIAGALLTYFSTVITQVDFGSWTPLVVAGFSVLANIVRKWIADNSA